MQIKNLKKIIIDEAEFKKLKPRLMNRQKTISKWAPAQISKH